MKPIVWVVPRLITPPRSGADLRTHRLMTALSAEADVRVVVVGQADPARLKDATGVQSVEVFGRAGRLRKGLTALYRGLPSGVAAAWSRQAFRSVARSAAEGAIIVVDHPQMAPYLPAGHHVLATQNAEYETLRNDPRPRSVMRRLVRRWDVKALRRLESSAVGRAGLVVVVSDHDRTLLRPDALIVPNGADVPSEAPPIPAHGPVIFIGSLMYAPNRGAIEWWEREVWPHLGSSGLPLTVIGGGAAGLRSEVDPAAVCLEGEVADLQPWLAAARVVAIPLQHGGGTRLKVLEALAWGRAVVSTSKGIEGLSVTHEREVLVADTGLEFAGAIARLLQDDGLAAELGSRGRQFAESYSWPRIVPEFAAAVATLRARPST